MIPSLIIRKVNEPFANLFRQLTRARPWDIFVKLSGQVRLLLVPSNVDQGSTIKAFNQANLLPHQLVKLAVSQNLNGRLKHGYLTRVNVPLEISLT